jgi:hypothetical protein
MLSAHLKPRRSGFFGPAAAVAIVVFCAAAAKFYVFASDAGGAATAGASTSLDAGDEAWELPTFAPRDASAITASNEDGGNADAGETANAPDAGEDPTTPFDAGWQVVPIDDFADPWLKPNDKASTTP